MRHKSTISLILTYFCIALSTISGKSNALTPSAECDVYKKCIERKSGVNVFFLYSKNINNGTHLVLYGKVAQDLLLIFSESISKYNSSGYVEVDISHGYLTETYAAQLELSNLTNLQKLDLSNNKIQRMNGIVPSLKFLERLDLSSNYIRELHGEIFLILPALKVFDIRYNCILIIDEVFRKSKSLQSIYFSNNIIQETIEIGDSVIRNQNLEEFDLSFNNITDFTFKSEFVRKIKFNDNNLRRVKFRPLMISGFRATKLEDLELQNNQLSIIEFPTVSQAEFINLKKLNLSNNKLEKILNINNITNLEILDLSNNPISLHTKDFETFTKLNVLILSNTTIDDQDLIYIFQNIKTIKTLKIDSNKKIKSLKGLESDSLEEMDVSNCQLETVNFGSMKNLKKLRISAASLNEEKLRHSGITKLTQLEELDFSHNEISRLNTNLFKPLKKLKLLNLSYNQIASIDEEDFKSLASSFTNKTRVDITGNSNELCDTDHFSYLKPYSNIYVVCKVVEVEVEEDTSYLWGYALNDILIKLLIVLAIFGSIGSSIAAFIYCKSRRNRGNETGIRYVNQLAGVNFLITEDDINQANE